jgi:hypothetical protein
MASKIGDVLEIKTIDLYMKRPIGPMITVEIQDINKLAGHIRIPSMADRATPKDTTLQKIQEKKEIIKYWVCRLFVCWRIN